MKANTFLLSKKMACSLLIVHFLIHCQRLAPNITHSFHVMVGCTQKCICKHPHLNTPYGSCNISSIARCITHCKKANTVLHVWKLHCAGRKIHSLTKSKISLVCIDGFYLFFSLIINKTIGLKLL